MTRDLGDMAGQTKRLIKETKRSQQETTI